MKDKGWYAVFAMVVAAAFAAGPTCGSDSGSDSGASLDDADDTDDTASADDDFFDDDGTPHDCTWAMGFLYDCGYYIMNAYGEQLAVETAIALCEEGDAFAVCIGYCVENAAQCEDIGICVDNQCRDQSDDDVNDDDVTDDDVTDDDTSPPNHDFCPGYGGSNDCCRNDDPCDWSGDGLCQCQANCDWDNADCGVTDDDVADDDGTTCTEVAQGMVNDCGVTIYGYDETMIEEWCQLTEDALDAAGFKIDSPTWGCFWDCVNSGCDIDCFNACVEYTGPGDGSCADTVADVFDCGIAWGLDESGEYQWWPADLALICSTMTDWSWDCIGGCADDYCPSDMDGALNCMNLC